MAIISDDCDVTDVRFYMKTGHNGDYYFTLIEYDDNQKFVNKINFRMATSGNKIPLNVKLAFVNLYNEMEKAGLNNHPRNETLKN